jgi:hypothetical protein
MTKVKETSSTDRRWNSSYGTYLSGQAAIDGADATAIEMERRWGAGRLRLLVSTELREKFDRQRFLYNSAIHHGDLEEVQRQAARMTSAWQALDRAAETVGALELSPLVWEVPLKDGTVVALVQSYEDGAAVNRESRKVVVYTLEEIARMLDNYREVVDAKLTFPGATITAIRRQSIEDPLQGIPDGVSLDDTLDDIPAFNAG